MDESDLTLLELRRILDEPFREYKYTLSRRELLILKLSAMGKDNKYIANQIDIKHNSVRMAMSRALRKVNLEKGDLTAYVFEKINSVFSDGE
jgi:DNA-binding NarL/FixJ family response regulator